MDVPVLDPVPVPAGDAPPEVLLLVTLNQLPAQTVKPARVTTSMALKFVLVCPAALNTYKASVFPVALSRNWYIYTGMELSQVAEDRCKE